MSTDVSLWGQYKVEQILPSADWFAIYDLQESEDYAVPYATRLAAFALVTKRQNGQQLVLGIRSLHSENGLDLTGVEEYFLGFEYAPTLDVDGFVKGGNVFDMYVTEPK